MPKAEKNKPNPINILVIMISTLVLASVGILTFFNYNRTHIDCSILNKNSNHLIFKRQYKAAYEQLVANTVHCGMSNSRNEPVTKLQELEFHHNLAVSAYKLNNKSLAKEEAGRGLAISQKMSDTEVQHVSTSFIVDMTAIKEDNY